MEKTKICWSGLTGRTGREAMEAVNGMSDVEIAMGISRYDYHGTDVTIQECTSAADGLEVDREIAFTGVKWLTYDTPMFGAYGAIQQLRRAGVNAMVDFSNAACFDWALELAIRTNVPLISGTSGLSDCQMEILYDATNQIPVFRGGNFRFKVKEFIDKAVEAARNTQGHLTLYERFYEGKSLPSETSKVIRRRIYEATGKTIEIDSSADLPKDGLRCNWRLDLGTELRNGLECHTIGFDELARDVLEIAKVMVHKPLQKGKFYDLDQIWDELPH